MEISSDIAVVANQDTIIESTRVHGSIKSDSLGIIT
jgi:hypothetical protein